MEPQCIWECKKGVGKEKKSLLFQVEQAAIVNGQNPRVRELKDEVNILLDREARLWSKQS